MNLVNARKGNWDFIKAVLMFLIVYGHICPASADRWNFSCRLIGLFVIPAFFFVSGYFQTRIGCMRDLLGKLKRTFMRITVPQMAWGVVYVSVLVAMRCYSGEFHRETLLADIFAFVKYSPFYVMGIFWFLTALQICIVFGSLMSFLINRLGCIFHLVLMLSMVAFCLMPTEMYHFTFIWFFYAGGMLYRQYENVIKRLMPSRGITMVLLTLSSVVMLFINLRFYPADSFYGASNLLRESSFGFILMRFAIYSLSTVTALGWLTLVYDAVKNMRVTRFLVLWGQDTLFVYCSHMLLLTFLYIPYKGLLVPDGGVWCVALTCLVSLIVTILLYIMLEWTCIWLKHSRVLRRLFMGA